MQEQQNEQTESRWQKIGQHGELLNFDALHWAAAVDKKTKLMWAINPSKTADFPNPNQELTWDEAKVWVDYVNTQGWCGFNNWRLPTMRKLKTLITKRRQPNFFIREDIFNDISDKYYRVLSSLPITYSDAWVVHFLGGSGHFSNKNAYCVRLVRSA